MYPHKKITHTKRGIPLGIGPRTRFCNFCTLNSLRSFVARCQPEDTTLAGFERSIRAWDRGSQYVHLTDARRRAAA
jgi:hypothetical protein